MSVEITKCLVLSTAHLPDEIRHTLEGQPGVSADVITYGYLVWVNEDMDEARGAGLPEVLMPIYKFAKEHQCDWLKFDCDGPLYSELTIFEEIVDNGDYNAQYQYAAGYPE